MPQTRRTLLKLFTTGAVVVAAGHRPTVGRDTEGGARVIPVPEPRIARFEELAYGMFVHWGVFSLMGQCVWAMHPGRFPLEDYKRQVPRFTAKEFNPRAWAATARRSGMRYMTLTARQHDGFSLYDTRGLSDYDAVHVGPGRDLVAEFVEGCRAEGIEPFLYHTTYDWYQPSFTQDFDAYLEYLHKSIEVLCTYYGKLGGFWFDGNWSKRDADWKEDRLYSIIRRLQPEAVIINNTGVDAPGALGHPEVDCVTFEQSHPTRMDRQGAAKYVAAEMCESMNSHWGITPNDYNYLSPKGIIEDLCACRGVGANLLLNIGPTPEGRLPAYESAAFERAGGWVDRHAEPIYKGKPTAVRGPGRDFAVQVDDRLFLFVHDILPRPGEHVVTGVAGHGPRVFAGVDRPVRSVRWMDNGEELKFERGDDDMLTVHVTPYPPGVNMVVRVAEVR